MKSRRFVDSVLCHVSAGNGGNGCVSFRREKFVPYGGPDGGDGARGGHVILRASQDEDSLVHLYFSPHQRAQPGGQGRGQRMHGRNGKDLVLNVPCGTVIHDADSGAVIGEVIEHGAELIVARGGDGGLGNCHWKTSTHRAPREHTDGGVGEVKNLRLELKIVADVGLVGFPNAGKSSLLTRLSDAHPKVASYPFTTLNPVIGTMIFDDYLRLRVADIPGIVSGAHEGVGLGVSFLRHIERAPFMVYVIDMAGVDTRAPEEDYAHLREELRLYREDLIRRPSLIVANKMDVPEAAGNLKKFRRETHTRPIAVSALTGEGLDKLRAAIRKRCTAQPRGGAARKKLSASAPRGRAPNPPSR